MELICHVKDCRHRDTITGTCKKTIISINDFRRCTDYEHTLEEIWRRSEEHSVGKKRRIRWET